MFATVARRWIGTTALLLACAVGAQPTAPARPATAPSVPTAKPAAPPAKASPSVPRPSAPSQKASAPAKPAAAQAKSLKVRVLFAETATQTPKPVAGAVVRLQGSEQTFATNASGVAEVFGVFEGKPQLTVIVVNASICNLPIKPAGGNLTVVVPKRGQGACRVGP